MNMRELVGVSLNSAHLESKEHAEMPIDRVGALAKASDLGRALFHWGYAADENAVRGAHKHLCRRARNRTKIYRGHPDYKMLERVCAMVLHEWRFQGCKACLGAGSVASDFGRAGSMATVACSTCSGSGKHRYADTWRMDYMNADSSLYRKWEKNIARVWDCVSSEDIMANRVCSQQLERDY